MKRRPHCHCCSWPYEKLFAGFLLCTSCISEWRMSFRREKWERQRDRRDWLTVVRAGRAA